MSQKTVLEAFDEFEAKADISMVQDAVKSVMSSVLLSAFMAGMDYGFNRAASVLKDDDEDHG